MSLFLQVSDYFHENGAELAHVFCTVFRYLAPLLGFWIVLRCARPLLRFRREPEIWAWLVMPDGKQLPVTHWENIIGRSSGCDIVVDFPTVSRTHAVLTRYDDGSWSVTDVGGRGAVSVNGEATDVCAVEYGDRISLGGVEMILAPVTAEEVHAQKQTRTKPSRMALPGFTLFLLVLFQLLTGLQFWMTCEAKYASGIVCSFLGLIGTELLLFLLLKIIRRRSFEVEGIAFFLSTLGLSVVASSTPEDIYKQLICLIGGVVIYLLLGWSLRDLNRAKKFRYLAAVGGILLLLANLVLGKEYNGARNWIALGPISFQPSELVKICFIYVGASTMDRIVTKRNMFSFIAYAGVICCCLALINDFGTALIFFVALVVICSLRAGSFSAFALLATVACAGILFLLAIDIPEHVMRRFKTWGHVWDDPNAGGYDQVRAMVAVASGGLLGLGAGNGMFDAMAADTDYVFAYVCEEWGLILGVLAVVAIIVLGLFVVRSCAIGRSSFYTIGACAAVAVLMIQTIFNVFGTMDLLPLTGVTFPFVSNGGSSMLMSWGMVAFIKAADTRQDASFVVKTVKAEEVEPYE